MNYFIINNNATVVLDNGDMIGKNNLTVEEINSLKTAIINGNIEEVKAIISPNLTTEEKVQLSINKAFKELEELPENSPFFMKNFNIFMKDFPEVPVPKNVVQMYYSFDAESDRNAVLKFWQLLVLNPNTRVRNELPKFLFNNGFHITNEGLIVTFRRAWSRSEQNINLYEWVINTYTKRKLQKKKVHNLYVDFVDDNYTVTEECTSLGLLTDLYNEAMLKVNDDSNEKYYADHATQTKFKIDDEDHYGNVFYQVGRTTILDRKLCDSNSRNSCSKGLHSGVPEYVSSYTSFGNKIFACLVNPYDVVSSPEDGWCKIRTSAIHIACEITEKDLEEYRTSNKQSIIDIASGNYHVESLERIVSELKYNVQTEGLTPEEYTFAITKQILNTYTDFLEERNVYMYDDTDDDTVEW